VDPFLVTVPCSVHPAGSTSRASASASGRQSARKSKAKSAGVRGSLRGMARILARVSLTSADACGPVGHHLRAPRLALIHTP
jgi:hypothetical protein